MARRPKHYDYYVRQNAIEHYRRGGEVEREKAENRAVLDLHTRLYSGGGKVEVNDDLSVDAKNASLRELQIALEQAAHEDQPSDVRADAPLNERAASFDQLANIRTGQGVRNLQYRWGEGAQTAKHQQQPTVGDIEDQALKTMTRKTRIVSRAT